MSSLRCPNCSGPFNEVLREGILIDVCQQCKGVWLDRGELEKLLSMAQSGQLYGEATPRQSAPPPQYHQPQDYRPTSPPPQYQRPDRDRDYYDHDNYKKHGYKKKKSRFEDIFDIFD